MKGTCFRRGTYLRGFTIFDLKHVFFVGLWFCHRVKVRFVHFGIQASTVKCLCCIQFGSVSAWSMSNPMASNAMTRIQTIFCFSVREPDTALSPLAIHFECVQISVFCYIFVIVDRSKANTWKCLRGKHLTSNTLKTWRDLAITSAALGRLFDARLVRPPLQALQRPSNWPRRGKLTTSSRLRSWSKRQRWDFKQ